MARQPFRQGKQFLAPTAKRPGGLVGHPGGTVDPTLPVPVAQFWNSTNFWNAVDSNNLRVTKSGNNGVYTGTLAGNFVTSGLYYWEISLDTLGPNSGSTFGIANPSSSVADLFQLGSDTNGWCWWRNAPFDGTGAERTNNVNGPSNDMHGFNSGDTLCFALNATTHKWWGRLNGGAWCAGLAGTQDPASGQGGFIIPSGMYATGLAPALTLHAAGDTVTGRFARPSWVFTSPVGFAAFSTFAGVGSAMGSGGASAVSGPITITGAGSASGFGSAGAFSPIINPTSPWSSDFSQGFGPFYGTSSWSFAFSRDFGPLNANGQGSAVGTGTATATGTFFRSGVGNASGTGSAISFNQPSLSPWSADFSEAFGPFSAGILGQGSAAGTGVATASGTALKPSTATASSSGVAIAQGISVGISSPGQATGSGVANAVGTGIHASTATSSGVGQSTASGTSFGVVAKPGSATGVGSASAIGSRIGTIAGQGAAAGHSAALGVAPVAVVFGSGGVSRVIRNPDGTPVLSGLYVGPTPVPLYATYTEIAASTGAPFFIVEVTAFQPGSGTTVFTRGWNETGWNTLGLSTLVLESTATIRASDVGYCSLASDPTGVQSYPPLLVEAFALDREIALEPTQTAAAWGWGAVKISNAESQFDSIAATWNADGRPIKVLRGTKMWDDKRGIWVDPSYNSLVPTFVGVSTPWFLDADTLTIPIRDATYWIERPVQSDQYLGAGLYSGTPTITGKPKPMARGGTTQYPIRNISPVLVDPVALIYQYNNGPGTVVNLYEGAALVITRSSDTTNLYAGSTLAGQYRTDNSRGLFQLGSSAVRTITCDVTGAFPVTGIVTSIANIAYYLLTEDMSLPAENVDQASFSSANFFYPYIGGVYFGPDDSPDGVTAMTRVLGSFGAKLIPDRTGRLRCYVLRTLANT